MGPEATLDFFTKILAATPAQSDQDHLHLIIENNPAVPNRHAAIRGQGTDPVPALVHMAQNLEHCNADFIVMPCNTAHAFQTDIEDAINIPFVSMIDETIIRLKKERETGCAIGLMAAEGCLEANLYQRALTNAGFDPICWTNQELATFMQLVYQIKAGARRTPAGTDIAIALKNLAISLLDRGAQLLLAGCTEIPLFLSQEDFTNSDHGCTFLSSTDILVHSTIAYARKELPLPGQP